MKNAQHSTLNLEQSPKGNARSTGFVPACQLKMKPAATSGTDALTSPADLACPSPALEIFRLIGAAGPDEVCKAL
jgi:hypothetical protein